MRYTHVALFALIACHIAPSVCAEPRGWAFMQSVGGIALSKPEKTENSWLLSIRANLSGLETITSKPSALNSALVCESVSARVESQTILIVINSALPRKALTAKCPPASLGSVASGRYRVLYQAPNEEPHFLGEVEIGF